jgi:hypothetical protein
MNRRISLLFAAAAVLGLAVVSAATDVTFIFKSGQRQSGQFVYHHDTNYNLIINGQERVFPSDDIALIAFVAGNPPGNEIAALSTDPVPLEHDRHMLAFRDGRTLRCKIYDFQGDNVIVDANLGAGNIQRQTFPMSSVARLYISAPASRDLFPAQQPQPAPGGRQPQQTPAGQAGTTLATVRVDATRQWTDTGIDVRQGDRLMFFASDEIRIDPRIVSGPGGTNSAGSPDRPLKALPVGALIGRVNPTTFPIGANQNPILIPAIGRLMLGINDNKLNDNSGAFLVRIAR